MPSGGHYAHGVIVVNRFRVPETEQATFRDQGRTSRGRRNPKYTAGRGTTGPRVPLVS
jgi:hypothetical protein